MGVPAHDDRDLVFACRNGLSIIPVALPQRKFKEVFSAYLQNMQLGSDALFRQENRFYPRV